MSNYEPPLINEDKVGPLVEASRVTRGLYLSVLSSFLPDRSGKPQAISRYAPSPISTDRAHLTGG